MIINLLVTNKKHKYHKEESPSLFLYSILIPSHTTNYYYSESLLPSDTFFFIFEYSFTGYERTITDARTHDSAGIRMIVYRMKSLWLSVKNCGFTSYAYALPTK